MRLHVPALLLSLVVACCARIWEIDLPRHLQDCYNQVYGKSLHSYVGSSFSWICETGIRSPEKRIEPHYFSGYPQSNYYLHLYDKAVQYVAASEAGQGRGKRQAGLQRCIRKEYRALTDVERMRYHNAINTLKSDTTVLPNKYDAIANLHTDNTAFTAHGGAGFLGWHRIFILMYEVALREVDPTVCLPYWDSSLDNELNDPTSSHIWTNDFFGTAQGPVTEGPFAGWTTPEGVELIRNVGSDGEPFTNQQIEDVLSRSSYEEIVTSVGIDPRYDLEVHHGAVHVFVGGAMGQIGTAAFDPIFFMHHAFVDYIFELFRTRIRNLGVDPEVYPELHPVGHPHHADEPTGFGNLTQADGMSDLLTEAYEYEPSPSCSVEFPDCGTRYLTCRLNIGRCVPVNPGPIVGPPPPPPPPPVPTPRPPTPPPSNCPRPVDEVYGHPVQNDYCCDKRCDTSQWALIPVKIVTVRPPKFSRYDSYPVRRGRVDRSFDIYAPNAYAATSRYISTPMGNPKTFSRCNKDGKEGQVFISSNGINYDGFYKETSVIDHRLATSISMGFVGIKKPTRGISTALIRAHDSCGRVCSTACRDPRTNEFKPCKGAIALSNQRPLMYGNNYDDAVLQVFDYAFDQDCPKFQSENFFITFYCHYKNSFPYAEPSRVPPPRTPPPPRPVVPSPNEGCPVSHDCVLNVPCSSAYHQCSNFNEKHVCQGHCNTYAVCTYGRYFIRRCPYGYYFDNNSKRCIFGKCQSAAVKPVAAHLPKVDERRRTNYHGALLKKLSG